MENERQQSQEFFYALCFGDPTEEAQEARLTEILIP
jgi:hypothetical protein